jgi:hypothetical protein
MRRKCPTCLFNEAEKDKSSNPGAVRKWWEEAKYVNYMQDPAKKPIPLKRSNAIRPGTPLMGSPASDHPGYRARTWEKKFGAGKASKESNSLFGTPPNKKEPSTENKSLAPELARAATVGAGHHYAEKNPEKEPKKSSRMSSVTGSIKRVLSMKSDPKKAKEGTNDGDKPTRWSSVKSRLSFKKPEQKEQDDSEDHSRPATGKSLGTRVINDDLTEDQVLQLRKEGRL